MPTAQGRILTNASGAETGESHDKRKVYVIRLGSGGRRALQAYHIMGQFGFEIAYWKTRFINPVLKAILRKLFFIAEKVDR